MEILYGKTGTLLFLILMASSSVIFTPNNFLPSPDSESHNFVMFHSEDCSYCKEVHDAFNSVQKHGSTYNETLRIIFGSLNVDSKTRFIARQLIPSIPHFRLYFSSGLFAVFQGDINKLSILEFIQSFDLKFPMKNPIMFMNSEKVFVNAKREKNCLIFSLPKINKTETDFLEDLQRIFPNFRVFYFYQNSKFYKRFFKKPSKDLSWEFLMKRGFDDGDKYFKQDEKFQAVDIFYKISKYQSRILKRLDSEILSKIVHENKKSIIFFDKNLNSKSGLEFQDGILKTTFSGMFVYSAGENATSKVLENMFGINKSEFPILVGISRSENGLRKFKLKSGFSESQILRFIFEIENNVANEYFKNTEIEKGTNEKKIEHFSRNTFLQNLKENKNDYFIAFVGDDCIACNGVESLMVQVQKILNNSNRNLHYGIFNLQNNDLENANGKEFPFFQFYKRGGIEKPVLMKKKRELNQIVRFLEKLTSRNSKENFKVKNIEIELDKIAQTINEF